MVNHLCFLSSKSTSCFWKREMRKWNSKGQHLKSTRLVSCEKSRDWKINHKTIKWSIKFKPGLFLLFQLCNTPSPMIRVFLFLVCTLFDNRQQEFCINCVLLRTKHIHDTVQFLYNNQHPISNYPLQSAELDKKMSMKMSLNSL